MGIAMNIFAGIIVIVGVIIVIAMFTAPSPSAPRAAVVVTQPPLQARPMFPEDTSRPVFPEEMRRSRFPVELEQHPVLMEMADRLRSNVILPESLSELLRA